MKIHNIPLDSIQVKSVLRNGETDKVQINIKDNQLHMLTLVESLSKKHQNYIYIPQKFKIPFRIDTTLKTNSPLFKFKIGNGYIMFSTGLNPASSGVSRADIFTGSVEQTKRDYDNIMPMNEYLDLSVIYGHKEMWVELNGKICYNIKKAPYMKTDVPHELKDGLGFAVACGGDVELIIKSLLFTEYDNDEFIPEKIKNLPDLSAFEWYLKSLPHEIRDDVVKTDEYLMKNMKETLKLKKFITKDGVVDYASPGGFRYALRRYDIGEFHTMKWNRGTGNFGPVLIKLKESSPDFANKIFANVNDRISDRGGQHCKQCDFTNCANLENIEYNGEIKRVCGGAVQFKWTASDFEDVRKVVAAVSEML